MATFRDTALAAYRGLEADWIARGREKLRPIFSDSTGKLLLDPVGKTTVSYKDREDSGLLVLTTSDGSNLSFAVYPDRAGSDVALVRDDDDQGLHWTRVRVVADLDDVGEAIADGLV